ncbi:hypothetical protein [Bacillus phage PM1]|uniref:Uncharacterized protein n=1 Tax=Bacillus phage PM1 TaxID=547228 RepID=M4ZQX6_9CAUD|nr:hypothetical protein K203_gp27 [Bacillus phage PM1]BAM99107.1 hypothetical protein [Bacillus phage PM1]
MKQTTKIYIQKKTGISRDEFEKIMNKRRIALEAIKSDIQIYLFSNNEEDLKIAMRNLDKEIEKIKS